MTEIIFRYAKVHFLNVFKSISQIIVNLRLRLKGGGVTLCVLIIHAIPICMLRVNDCFQYLGHLYFC